MVAPTRAINRLELGTIQQPAGDATERDVLLALSQRKLNALGIPLAYVDRSRRYRFANKAFLDWIAKRHDEVIGREVIEVLGRDVYGLYEAYIDAATAGERTGYERQLTTPGRPPLWIRVDYYPDRTPQGQVRGFLVAYADVDHLKRLELEAGQREHRLRLVTDSVGSPILYFDRQMKVRFANRPFADWIGVPGDDLLGHAVRDVLSGEAFSEMQGYIERAFAGASVAYERRDRRASGELRWVRVTLFPDRE
ncbi:MAG: PAS domain-containing protein, partial [Aromatoleum sp.]|nr:PAS domain-containing protein [Aromatoleum sp.]